MKLKHIGLTLFSLTLLKMDAHSTCSSSNDHFSNICFQPDVTIGYSVGKFIGIDQDYGEVGLFLPLYQSDCSLSFVDCHGYRYNDAKWAASAGFGYRKWMENGHIVGANIYYDFLDANFHKSFSRIGLGIEWLGECWDLRLNAYIPLGSQSINSKITTYDNYTNGYVATSYDNEFTISNGFDAEIGLPFWHWNNMTAYGAIGPYYFAAKNATHYFGGQARIEIQYNAFLSLQVRSSYDSENHSRTQGQIELTVPFEVLCGKFTCICRNLISQPVYRNGIIFTDDRCKYTKNW